MSLLPLHDRIAARRRASRLAEAPEPVPSPPPPAAAGSPERLDDVVGLALSGGGIRSATFCFGLLRALAAKGMLSCVDLMSTVSGGSYVGSMLGSLYSQAANPGEVRAVTSALADARSKWFTWWLRANGRYLMPRGTRDSLFAGALYARNLLGVHFEFALMAVVLGVVLAAVDLAAWHGVDAWAAADPRAFAVMRQVPGWVPAICLAWLPLALLALVFSTAYWCLPWVADAKRVKTFKPMLAVLAGAALLAFMWWHAPDVIGPGLPRSGQVAQWTLWAMAVLLVLGWILALVVMWATLQITRAEGDVPWIARAARTRVTRWLATCLELAGMVFVLALLQRCAWTLAFESDAVGEAGFALAALAAVLRALLPVAGRAVAGRPGLAVWLAAGRVLGYGLTFALATLWVSVVYRAGMGGMFWSDGPPPYGEALRMLAVIAVPVAAYMLLTGRNFEFLNQSSLHGFYRARLSRSHLGAANPSRFGLAGLAELLRDMPADMRTTARVRAVEDLDPRDDPDFADYAPHRHGGPVHLINVCVNQTRDPKGGRLYNQDRRGLLLTVASGGLHRISQGRYKQLPRASTLTLGGWTAVSGAAVAPGLGNLTRGGISALATFAGVRLGYWWQRRPVSSWEALKPCNWLLKSAGLLRETLGIFRGTERRDWFLTDGGHFENTGAYALLAERAKLIIVADCGADPDYRFEDLENLVRKARIDLQAEIRFLRPRAASTVGAGGSSPDVWRDFGAIHELASANSAACLALAHVRYGGELSGEGLLVVVKPALCEGLPVDLLNFRMANPDFPQETTADQFFSEAQWDAYFELGSYIGSKLPLDLLRPIDSVLAAFEDDTSTLKTVKARADGGAEFVSARARAPVQLAAVTVGSATLGLGGVAAAGVAAWQAIETVRATATKSSDAERQAVRDLADAWGRLEAPSLTAAGERTARHRSDVATLATLVVKTADTVCVPGEAARFAGSTVAGLAYRDAVRLCRALDVPQPPACQVLIAAADPMRPHPLLDCFRPQPPASADARAPRNWYYDYSSAAPLALAHPADAEARRRRPADADLLPSE